MSFTLNTAALTFLLESTDGPVGQAVQRKAELITENAKTRAKVIMHKRPSVVDQEVGFQMRADQTAIVGISDSSGLERKSISRYLAEKEAKERVWLVPAVRDAFPG